MGEPLPFTPLNALRLIAFDTETTGLDTASDRLVQIAAIELTDAGTPTDNVFSTLINPGVAIPATATAIHGIADDDVTTAIGTADALRELASFLAGGVVIGHTIGFDLEVFRHEADRHGVDEWQTPPGLDISPMARAVLGDLTAYDLDGLCEHLGIEIRNRHSAEGDAIAAARVFEKLLPKLRQRGVRTLAETHTLCRRVWEREGSSAAAAGRVESIGIAAPSRIDSYPYRHRISGVMSAPPAVLEGGQSLRTALDMLIASGISSVFVSDPDGQWGIVTERDVLRALNADGTQALDNPIATYRSTPLASVAADDLVYRAIGRMDRLGVRHLGVLDHDGSLVGAVTTRNLLRHRASSAMILGDEIAGGETVADLAAAWGKVPEMARQLSAEDVDARMTAGVISDEIQMLTRRAAEMGESRLREEGLGDPPAPYAVLVLGSAGRGESLLAADQDNALVYEPSAGDAEAEAEYFARLGTHIADTLDRIGIPYCKGGVMAQEADWRKPLAAWHETVDGWIGKQRPEDLLNVDIFFDAVVVHGDRELGQAPQDRALEKARQTPSFRVALSQTMRDWRSPLTMFGGFRTGTDERVDLKASGLMPIFASARILAMKAGANFRSTPDRLRAAAEAGLASEAQLGQIIEAHGVILKAMLQQQLEDASNGLPLKPRVAVGMLSRTEQATLRDALKQVSGAIDLVREGML